MSIQRSSCAVSLRVTALRLQAGKGFLSATFEILEYKPIALLTRLHHYSSIFGYRFLQVMMPSSLLLRLSQKGPPSYRPEMNRDSLRHSSGFSTISPFPASCAQIQWKQRPSPGDQGRPEAVHQEGFPRSSLGRDLKMEIKYALVQNSPFRLRDGRRLYRRVGHMLQQDNSPLIRLSFERRMESSHRIHDGRETMDFSQVRSTRKKGGRARGWRVLG